MSSVVDQLATSLSQHKTAHARNLSVLLTMIRHERIISDPDLASLLVYAGTDAIKQQQQKLRAYMLKYDYSPSSVASYSSRLKKLINYYQDHCLNDALPTQLSIGEKLSHLTRKQLGSCSQKAQLDYLHTHSGIPVPTLKRWMSKGSKPTKNHHDALTQLAHHFNVSPHYLSVASSNLAATSTSKIAHNAIQALPKVSWDDKVQTQIERLLLFKTKARTPALSHASFKLNRREAQALIGGGRWTTNADGSNASARNFERMLERYFRWLCANFDIESTALDLSMLLVIEYLEAYVDDCLESEFYATLQTTLNLLSGLIDPMQGYLTRYHAPVSSFTLNDKVPTEAFDNLTLWLEQANYLSSQVKSWQRDVRHLMAELQHDADDAGKRNIGWLLDGFDATLEQSVSDIHLLAQDLLEHSKKCTGVNRIAPAQISLWLLLSLEVPLRISNWCALQWLDKDNGNTPALFEDKTGLRIKVPRSYLKNRRGREVEAIDVLISNPKVTTLLALLKQIRAESGIHSEALFVQTRASNQRALGDPYQRTALAKSVQAWTARAAFTRWPERNVGRGINPHGMRHFVASYVLDRTGDYRLAATSLMDSVAVVMNVYGKNDHSLNQKKLSELHQSQLKS
ncbi:hypothetical protein [Pseudoalteromonas umbrosa]|uniref:hypothetical protein n=1 Tax=Pseudoalteromonas umbrosa TaxID=3048489 RepID=UPI0024C24762|nr:hypothetical protein [Pseudoalteromonas sp. B95]MDK1290088.1 hypothetical protein [Pseudoalteromonas sp. B95]